MVELSYFPALLRNIRWGNLESNEKEKHLREPLLHDSGTDDSSNESDGEQPHDRYASASKRHVVVTVEPKFTRSERLLRTGWAVFTRQQQHSTLMNTCPPVETPQDIVNAALAKMAGLTVAAVSMLVLALYRQAAAASS
ncbi:Aste57867_21713 [Aphanomyces stellatus]|uniref:Aste57867_21713 protein n=1 Tax=Aphanomyces stellatus TaxID=120398 RepID=A0A485LI90_9STRA|nr:hypothetical protein As57867_021644 [Aphanomyces stellatus]VFT98382.1 Aste57867_21713 [Aphanomyces stellatus]